MLKITLIVLAVIAVGIIGILAYAATRPDDFRVQRSTVIKAPAEKIFPFINDFKQWGAWSPYEKIDPAMKRIYGATTAGKGATYAWEGNNNVGSGSMEILNAPAPSQVTIKLDFMKPFEAHNTADFTLMPSADGTTVTWAMHGKQPFLGRVMCMFMNMDRMIGTDFETGLANLKALAEK